jgi:hypothetical protein
MGNGITSSNQIANSVDTFINLRSLTIRQGPSERGLGRDDLIAEYLRIRLIGFCRTSWQG